MQGPLGFELAEGLLDAKGTIDEGTAQTRRSILTSCVAATTLLIAPSALAARTSAVYKPSRPSMRRAQERILSLYNTHTDEKVTARYWLNGSYRKHGLHEINRVMRDHRSNRAHPIDPDLLDLLYVIQKTIGRRGAFHIVSGYRTPETNNMLARILPGVAEHSMHTQGRAVDIRLPGSDLRDLHRAARGLRGGGVGYYPQSNFIHVDVGRVRYW
jgi:uncharacterized protein YcbK (DUF882 family)